MSESFMEITKEEIESVENALKVNADYKLNNTKFNTSSFEKGQNISIMQYVANVENEFIGSSPMRAMILKTKRKS